MKYRIDKADRSVEDGGQGLIVSLGYGRKFTGYHSIRSEEQFNIIFEFEGVRVSKVSFQESRLV
jgi:hypothetical protein